MSKEDINGMATSKNTLISGKTVALGVSGGIACYKVADLASRLVKYGATVKTIMTKNATEFISPLTFKTITSQQVLIDLFSDEESNSKTCLLYTSPSPRDRTRSRMTSCA
jgi:hypothetical protein